MIYRILYSRRNEKGLPDMDYLLNDDKSDNDLARKIFIFSNPGLFLLSCPPPCGHFLIQQSTAGGLSYKVKKAVNSAHLQAPVPPWETHQKNVSCVLVS